MSSLISQAVRELAEPKLAEFTAKLLPTVDPARILGVRTPALRRLAKKLLREHPQEVTEFKAAVPHDFQEEDLLHVLLLNYDELDSYGCRLPSLCERPQCSQPAAAGAGLPQLDA